MSKIEKIEITDGVYWVAIAKAGLKLLCASPADTVKHLIKVGLIHKTEKNGVQYERGPSAILLSDIMVQNGEFSNLAEFPILQMLYRQGMIIPNHPGNTGRKPMLIGSKSQVNAQLDYIYRGNYGLTSVEEIMKSGVSKERAEELYRMKLKFAFGKIRDSEEFIDKVVLEEEKTEVVQGVFIERKSLNVFEITFEDESVTIDLNLKKNQKYKAPYPLGFYNLKREYFAVADTGSGDGWDVDRPSMGSVVMMQGKVYLVDAGPNILNVLIALGIGIGEIEGVFHTHSHDDHFAGLTALIRSGKKIKYFATRMVRESVIKKITALMKFEESSFYNFFDVVDLEMNKWTYVNGMEVKPLFSPHPVETNIYLFRSIYGKSYKVYGHFADIVSLTVLKSMITESDDEPGVTQEMYEKVKKTYLKKLDLKKVDIGGGMIHGDIQDFKDDKSEKILLAHTSTVLSMDEKEIGSSAALGVVDVLIPSYQDFLQKKAHDFLRKYFPSVGGSELRMLLNHPIVSLNPEFILIKSQEKNDKIFLVLTGNVEVLQTKLGIYDILSSGAFIGELSGILGAASIETYRAASFVNALEIPAEVYKKFIRNNSLYADVEKLKIRRDYLTETWLFGESIPYTSQNKIANSMELFFVEDGKEVEINSSEFIYTVFNGEVEVSACGVVFPKLKYGDSFGIDISSGTKKSYCKYRAVGHTGIYKMPVDTVIDIPIVRWKLNEINDKRKSMLENAQCKI